MPYIPVKERKRAEVIAADSVARDLCPVPQHSTPTAMPLLHKRKCLKYYSSDLLVNKWETNSACSDSVWCMAKLPNEAITPEISHMLHLDYDSDTCRNRYDYVKLVLACSMCMCVHMDSFIAYLCM